MAYIGGRAQSQLQAEATYLGRMLTEDLMLRGFHGKDLTDQKVLLLTGDPRPAAHIALQRIKAGKKAARTRKANNSAYGPIHGPRRQRISKKTGLPIVRKPRTRASRARAARARIPRLKVPRAMSASNYYFKDVF
jgi:hypothetical protein